MRLLRKTYSLKRNVLSGAATGVILGATVLKNRRNIGAVAGGILGAGVGLATGLTLPNKFNPISPRTEKEEQEILKNKLSRAGLKKLVLPLEIVQLQKIERDPKLLRMRKNIKTTRTGADFDDYPQFIVEDESSSYLYLNSKDELIGGAIISSNTNHELNFSYNFNTKTWMDWRDRPVNKAKIKKTLLVHLENDLEHRQKWAMDEVDVIEYTKYLIQLIKTKF